MESSSSRLYYYLPQCNETAEVILMRTFCRLLLSSALVATIHSGAVAETDHADIKAEVTKRHDDNPLRAGQKLTNLLSRDSYERRLEVSVERRISIGRCGTRSKSRGNPGDISEYAVDNCKRASRCR
jgi:hypothetical protein